MDWQKALQIIALINQAALAMSDGKLTADEAVSFITTALKMFGIDIGFGDLFTFESREGGDLYIVIKKQLMEKIAAAV